MNGLVKIIVNYQFDTTTEIVAPEELTDESTEESTGMPTEEPTEEPTDEPCLEILMTTTHSAPTRDSCPTPSDGGGDQAPRHLHWQRITFNFPW